MRNRTEPTTIGDARQEQVLAALLMTYPALQTKNWRAAVAAAFQDEDPDFLDMIGRQWIIPDAFAIHKELREIVLFEVEVHSPMSGDKLRSLGKLAIDCAYYGIQIAVMVVNKHGHVNPVDLLPHYRDWLARISGTKC